MNQANLAAQVRQTVTASTDAEANLQTIAAAVQAKPFDAELRRLFIAACVETRRWSDAARAVNEKADMCGLKRADGNLLIQLRMAMLSGGCAGPEFELFLTHAVVKEVTGDLAAVDLADAPSVCTAAQGLIGHGMVEAACDLIARGLERTPDHRGLLGVQIRALVESGDYAGAAIVADRKRGLEDFADGERPLLTRLRGILLAEEIRGDAAIRLIHDPFFGEKLADNSRYSGFESLGNDCEFGNVQRKLGQEPLGLLRFASLPLDKLTTLLNNGFARFAQADRCELRLAHMGAQMQYDLYDREYGYEMHTFIAADKTTDMATVLARFCARVQFLRRKLLEDLHDGEKIFIYKAPTISTVEAKRLSQALQRHGPNRLLVVQIRPRTSGEQGGRLLKVNDRLVMGYLERFDVHVTDLPHLQEWKELLDATLAALAAKPRRSWAGMLVSKTGMYLRRLGA
jgi:hypothetical protein